METSIIVYSQSGTVEIGKAFKFTGFIAQAEAYFNRFGHLPKKGDMVMQDSDSDETSACPYVDLIEYRGEINGKFEIGISVTLEEQ